jgi:DNA-directed RNA polymerase subunit beta
MANTPLPPLDLIAVQKESWEWFLRDGIKEALAEISPVEDFTGRNWSLAFGDHHLGTPTITPEYAHYKAISYTIPLRIQTTLLNKRTGKTTQQEVFLGDIPHMTSRGTFVINGIERAVVNQIIRSPGVYFAGDIDQATGRMLYRAELRPIHGAWIEFEVARDDVIYVRIDRRRKFPVTVFLRTIGVGSDEEIMSAFADTETPDHSFMAATIAKDPTKSTPEAFLEIFRKMRPGDPVVLETAQSFLHQMFFDPRRYELGSVGRYKINKRLGLDIPNITSTQILTRQDVVTTVKYLINLQKGKGKVDDIDHLANRRLRRVGELVQQTAFRVGLMRFERTIKEKMSLVSTEELITPQMLINVRPIISQINEFFRQSQLSSILDQTNPLSEVDNLRKISVMGQGGISRERASFSIRDINSSQYSRIDPIRSPEGPNIGLVTYLALFARVNNYGFIEAPYRKTEKIKISGKTTIRPTNEIVYLTADDEESFHTTDAQVPQDKFSRVTSDWVPYRYNGEFTEGPTELVDMMDIVPRQVLGVSSSLIPFVDHDDINRALMGAGMQCQAVPLLKPAAPIVGTGMELIVPTTLGRVAYARSAGKVIYVDARKVIIKLDVKPKNPTLDDEHIKLDGDKEIYTITKFKRTSSSTCYSQRPVVSVGDKVKKGDLVIDGPACDNGELALGQNLIIAYMSWEGLGYEDAIVISDRLVKEDVLTSIHIEEYEAAVVETKLGPEELTRDIPNVGEGELAHLGEDGIVTIGSEVSPNDILVGKIAPKGETELTAEERLLRAIFGEKAREVRDTSLRVPHGERGTVIDVQILDREKGDELAPGEMMKVIVRVAQIRKISVGDKLAGRHGNKGVISKIVPASDMPYLPDGSPVDIIISPLSVLARMNLGQLLEAHLGWAAQKLGYTVAVPPFEKIPEGRIIGELEKAKFPVSGKITLVDGKTGQPFDQLTTIGVAYIMKLIHMVEDKTHARSTGPYSLVTQQPLGGKAQMGGQRLGEMEVWALEAHRAAAILQEMLTIKSDDVYGRAKAFEAMVKGTEIPRPAIPESFKVLVSELKSLAVNIIPKGVVEVSQEEPTTQDRSIAQAAKELAEASGAQMETTPQDLGGVTSVVVPTGTPADDQTQTPTPSDDQTADTN